MDESNIELMIYECLEAVEDYPDRFSRFEIDFLESVEEKNETGHLSTVASGDGISQLDKLIEIYEERITNWKL